MQANPAPLQQPDRQSLSVDDAQKAILDSIAPIKGWCSVSVRTALGRVLADDVIAPFNVPAHDNSAMDGYAMRAADLLADSEARLAVVGTALAGVPFSGLIGKGQAVRVMTGAVLPRGADCVVVQEITRTENSEVIIPAGQRSGQNIRRAGEDLAQGAVALPSGKRLGPAELGLIASLGIAEVKVRRRLRVAFFSTGDEIASIGSPLAPGQIYDSNRYILFGVLSHLDCELLDMGVIPDQPAALEKALVDAAASADVILTSGGVSVGEADFIKALLQKLGDVAFWKINIKPGRPMAFGKIGTTLLFGLPGNPVAVMVTYYQFVLDALLKLMGVAPLPERPLLEAECTGHIRKQPGRREFIRASLHRSEGGWKVEPTGAQGSGVLRSMSEANCFIVLPESSANVAPGSAVQVQLFEGFS